jgi:acyl-CoA synthetase (AMP-forming)/AMP-acid ligase II
VRTWLGLADQTDSLQDLCSTASRTPATVEGARMIRRSPLPDVEVPAIPITGYVLERAPALGHKPALVDGPTGRALSYAALDQAIHGLAAGLARAGFRRGDVLALVAPNCPEYAVVFHAAAVAGGVITTINPSYTGGEMHHQLVDSGAGLLVVTEPFLATACSAAEGTAVRQTYLLTALGLTPLGLTPLGLTPLGLTPLGLTPRGAERTDGAGAGTFGLPDVFDLIGDDRLEQVPVDPDDVVALPYSSGTTGGAKGVMLTHRNLVANIAQSLGASQVREDETMIAVLPFFHIYGMQVLMNAGLRAGATIVTMLRFDLAQFLDAHQRYSATRSFVVPPIVLALAKHPMVDSYDLSSVEKIISGAAPMSADLAQEAARRLNCKVVQGYGMTEMSPVSHHTPAGSFVPGSVGVNIPNTEARIVDPVTGDDLPDGVDGEVWIRGPQVMKGYLNNEKATADTLDTDGWLHTGDIGHFEPSGHLFVVDRLKELIKVSGFQVPPAELEALLLTHPAVVDAAVVGIADEESGEVPAAFVVLRPGAEVDETEILDFVAGRVAGYKRLRRVTFLEAIPKSAAGKILRRVLRAQAPIG